MAKYPYPVLAYEDSSYVDGIKFELLYIDYAITGSEMVFTLGVEMNSMKLRKYIENDDAKLIVKVQTSLYSQIYDLDPGCSEIKCPIRTENIQKNDTVKFIGYIVAAKELVLSMDEEILPVYGDDYTVTIAKNDILAVSNVESLSYSSGDNNFIKFCVADEMSGKGFSIRYATNYIEVLVGEKFNRAYGSIKSNKPEVCTIFNCHLVFEVLVYVLMDLIQDYDEYRETEWYRLFDQVFMQTGECDSFEEFINQAKDGNRIQIDRVYELAHIMINNQIENSIIAVGVM